jgi:hypothetical protein
MKRIIVAVFVLALFTGTAVFGQEKGRLLYLKQYAGTYQHAEDPLFQDPEVKRLLSMALGKELEHFFDNIKVKGPVSLISGDLVVSGNGVHQGGSEEAIVAISLYSGGIHAAILTQGQIRIFGGTMEFSHLPNAVRDWVTLRSEDCARLKFRNKMPSNASMVKPSITSLQNATINDFVNANSQGVSENELIDFILAGLDVRLKDDHGRTPLHIACLRGFSNLAKLLVSKGSDVNAKDDRDETPLMYASLFGKWEVAKILLENRAEVNEVDARGWTALMEAAQEGHQKVVELLLKNARMLMQGFRMEQRL